MKLRVIIFLSLFLPLILIDPHSSECRGLPPTGLSIEPRGSFLRSAGGLVHYKFSRTGLEKKGLVVLVHGFSAPMEMYTLLDQTLIEAGYPTILYDLPGRGFSEACPAIENEEYFVSQLVNLLYALNITEPVHFIGFSMGAIITSRFAQLFPHKVLSLAWIAPAGVKVAFPTGMDILKVPYLGQWIVKHVAPLLIRIVGQNQEVWDKTGQTADEIEEGIKTVRLCTDLNEISILHNPAYLRSLGSSFNHINWQDNGPAFRAVGKTAIPTLAVWGEHDDTCLYEGAPILQSLIPQLRLVTIPRARHGVDMTHPRAVNAELLKFFDSVEYALPRG